MHLVAKPGEMSAEELARFLDLLEQTGSLTRQGNDYYWLADRYPAAEVSLRSSTPNVVSLNVVDERNEIKFIGSVDANAARWYVHKEAIYLHDAEMYEVLDLNLEQGTCYLQPSQSEYYTIPVMDTKIIDYSLTSSVGYQNFTANYGSLDLEISINTYQKKRWMTNELLGVGQIDLPPQNLHTTGFWLGISPSFVDNLRNDKLWGADPNIYGPEWNRLRQKILLRDNNTCRACGKIFEPSELHVHHIQPFRSFAYPTLANQASVMVRSGLAAAAYALRSIALLLIMCDREDVSLLSENRSVLNDANPAILVYDNIPGGIGLSRKLFGLRNNHVCFS